MKPEILETSHYMYLAAQEKRTVAQELHAAGRFNDAVSRSCYAVYPFSACYYSFMEKPFPVMANLSELSIKILYQPAWYQKKWAKPLDGFLT